MTPEVARLRGLIGLLAELAVRDVMDPKNDDAADPAKDSAASHRGQSERHDHTPRRQRRN